MPSVFLGNTFAFKNVTKMSPAVATKNLDSGAICINLTSDCPLNLIVKSGPAAVRLEFIFRAVQWLLTLTTDVASGLKVIVVFARKRALGAFL